MTRATIRVLAICLSGFFLYTSYFGTFYPFVQRAVPLAIGVALVFLTIRARSGIQQDRVPVYDWILALAAIPVFGYAAYFSDHLANRWPMSRMSPPSDVELVLGVVAILLIFEAVRRTIGITLVAVSALMMGYTLFGDQLPWLSMRHSGTTLVNAIDYYFLTMEGIWGTALGIAATYIALFVIFGAFMEKGGANDFFLDISNAIAGETRGGPAKVAIFASGLVGSVTGSTVANVYTTGLLSIPLMKKVGYKPSFAGAVEALASNGGQMMPPIMGAAAFLVASQANVTYTTVIAAAIAPALLYYAALMYFIHLEAINRGLSGLPKGTAPRVGEVLLRGGHLLIPLFLLIVLLARGFSPLLSGCYAIVAMIALSWVRKDTRIGPKEFLEAMEKGARNSLMIIVVCACVGLVVGTFTLTGLGLTVSSALIRLSGDNFLLLLGLVFLASLILGTGMNTVAAFILVSVAAVPALTAQGMDAFSANMVVFYFSLLSMITPPVCLAVFAAAAIANANIWETSFMAVRLGVVAFLLPFLAAFSPGLLLIGDFQEIVTDIASTSLALFFLVTAIQNQLFGKLPLVLRLMLAVGSAGLLLPTTEYIVGGFLVCCLAVLLAFWFHRRSQQRGPTSQTP